MSLMEKDRPPSRARRRFTKEFKADAVALVLDGERPVAHVARDLGIGESNLGNWVRQARVDRGEKLNLTSIGATTGGDHQALLNGRLSRRNAGRRMVVGTGDDRSCDASKSWGNQRTPPAVNPMPNTPQHDRCCYSDQKAEL